MIGTLLKLATAALGIWQSKESRKYQDQLLMLRTKWDKEYAKDPRDDNELDVTERRIELLVSTIADEIERQTSKN